MKKRLIHANRLKAELRNSAEYHAERRLGYFSAIDHIDEQPTVDAVEVVRCKDCLYSTERYGHMDCIHGVSYRNTWNKPDFFCSYGKRKEGAD